MNKLLYKKIGDRGESGDAELSFFIEFLIEHKINGVTALRLHALRREYGCQLVNLFFQGDFVSINKVWGYEPIKIQAVADAWHAIATKCHLYIAMRKAGLSYPSIRKIYKKYQGDSLTYLCGDPYILMWECGYGFRSVDAIGRELGISGYALVRVNAAVISCLREHEREGHTMVAYQECQKYIDVELCDCKKDVNFDVLSRSVEDLICHNKIVYCDGWCGFKKYFDAEKDIAHFIKMSMQNYDHLGKNNKLTSMIASPLQSQAGTPLSFEQAQAVKYVLEFGIGIITGGAGTGKSTVIYALYDLLRIASNRIVILTPTGRAAQRLASGFFDIPVMTIHKFFFSHRLFFHDEYDGPYPKLCYEYIIIDESSMIDSFLLATLLRCFDPCKTAIYFFGDSQQLPPIGAGAPFHTFLLKGSIPHVYLTNIFRQQEQSNVLPLAYAVAHQKKYNFTKVDDISWVSIKKDLIDSVLHAMIDANYNVSKRILGFVGITFLNRGLTGAVRLNIEISNYIHDTYGDPSEQKIFDMFYPYDIVIVNKNIYKKNLCNGQMGRVVSGDSDNIVIYFHGQGEVLLTKEYASCLALGYVVNVYKSQGSEFQKIVVFLFMEHYLLLNRSALYTAITRTKKNVIFVGEKKAFYCACGKDGVARNQFLALF